MFIPNASPDEDVSKEVREKIEYDENLEKAISRFQYNCGVCNIKDYVGKDLSKWNLADYVREASCVAGYYSIYINEHFNMTLEDMQKATSKDTEPIAFSFIKAWRIWQNMYIHFINEIPKNMQPNAEHFISYVDV